MSRISKWKLEKTKVKVVFRLQFHATHIPQTGWDKLFISFIPSDSGKATAKTTKTNVRNGTCKWADPIYETTRLLQDSKSRQCEEKLYKIIVAMGTSRASTLGEATINLADYVDALKPSAVTLPLHGWNFGTILHITVQLLTSKTGFREFEQQRELREKGIQPGPSNDQNDKATSRVKSTTDGNELSPLEEEVNPDEEYADSATGFDGLSNSFGNLYAEKLQTSSTHEIDCLKSTMSGDLHVLSLCQCLHTVKPDPSDHQNTASTGSAKGWGSDNSIENELAMASEEYNRLRGSLELAESSFSNLKLEVSSLQSLADDLGAETQRFSHQLAAEISSAEELAKEVSVMITECMKFKDDIIRLKDLNPSRPQVCNPETSENQADHLVQNIQLQFLKGITLMESKIRELQGKKYLIPHDGEAKFIYSELEALLHFLLDVKLGNGEMTKLLNALPSETVDVKEITELNIFKDDGIVISGNGLGLDLCEPESILQNFSMIPRVSEAAPLGAVDAMKGQILDLVRELDEAKVEKEALTRKMNQMESYYEALIHELEENKKCMLGELQHLRNEHSTCLYSLSVSKSETESLRHDMNHQMLQFVDERRELEVLNRELERRATTTNASLRRARLNYSIAVDKLQKDLQLLSSQIISMFETNANLIKQALPAQPHSRGDLMLVQNPKDGDVTKFSGFLDQSLRSMGGEILMEDLKRSLRMQEEHYQKVEKELNELYSINFNLDIYSRALQESLCEADADIRIMKGKMDELVEELKLSTAPQNQLMIRLPKATDNIHALNEYKYSSISQYSDMTLQNHLLEDKLMSTSEESYLLAQKLNDLESFVMEYRSCQSKYEACLVENAELSLRLKQEGFENEKLTNEISLLKERSMILKSESDELVSSKENLERSISFVQNKLANLLASYNRQFCFMDNSKSPNLEIVDVKDAIFQLEKTHHNVCAQYCELMEENQNLKSERAIADVSLSTFISEIQTMKQNFRSGIEDMVTKLAVSNALVEKLQDELESVANKLYFSEIEEKYAQLNEVLLADFALLESQMQEFTSKKGHLAQEILSLDSLADELERNELTISKLTHENQELAMCLQEKTEESIKLVCEMREEKAYKDELEGKLGNLTFHLNKDQDKLLTFEQQKADLMHVRELASDFESDKSRLVHLLDQKNAFIEEYKRNNSNQAGFESQLLEMHDYSLAADVKLIYVANHYEALTEELVQKLESSDSYVKELGRRHNDMDVMLNQCLAGEANWREEKSNLFTSLESLRSDLEVSEAQNKLLSDSNNEIRDQLEEYKSKLTMMEINLSSDSMLQASEIERLKNMMIDAEDKISYLAVSQEEFKILAMILKSKFHEQSASITSLEEYKDELTIIRSQCDELSHKLSEQIWKTEELKNLCTHLKELKDKAESECLLAHGKKETEVTYTAGQDSLRIAFIKEQYETQVQELKLQVSIAKKHGEEMLLKLQDAIDEIENRKKSEAVNSKKNKELVLRLSTLEAELRLALTEKREKSNACDRTKTELECALLSLECCKEEKGKLEFSLLEFEAEKFQLAIEVNAMKAHLENLKSSTNFGKDEYGSVSEVEHTLNGSTRNTSPLFLEQDDDSMAGIEKKNNISILDGENADSTEPSQSQNFPDVACTGLYQNPEYLVIEELPQSKNINLDVSSGNLGAQRLKSSMEHLQEELEKMKNENKSFNIGHDVDPDFQVLQREIMKLHKANEELGSMFPFFNENPVGGNAVQLEIEVAEALKAKNKSNIIFQSSFLKQDSDEDVVFKSFRDINELIKELLGLKERHSALEAELRQMHDSYSQLSLQFAEVEGERQKLEMTLKNIRTFRKLVALNP